MTDYEINKRLAEIAGHEVVTIGDGGVVWVGGLVGRDYVCVWSPLTDWSQLGPLMERFETDVLTYGGEYQVDVHVEARAGGHTSTDLKRAICLAIIAAHEEGTT